ncbi:hypothetical protein AAFF_G00081120 [Aldrovandia affinis]|uniref:Uncharacterized protein n=1 Tax=Aldrovandia affinis TaxID=143900 RepID=A0AAD7T3P4_9TELE|nr:hypothetical protein AAFF_G00081120 [Aldrovandia affinis]
MNQRQETDVPIPLTSLAAIDQSVTWKVQNGGFKRCVRLCLSPQTAAKLGSRMVPLTDERDWLTVEVELFWVSLSCFLLCVQRMWSRSVSGVSCAEAEGRVDREKPSPQLCRGSQGA